MADKKSPTNPSTIADDIDLKVADPQNSAAIAVEPIVVGDNEELSIRAASTGEKIKAGGEKIAGEAADKARGFVAQGLERTADALTSVSKMVGDTADGIGDRVGPEYGDYARKASKALDKAAQSLGTKDPEELIEDTRSFVRKSPGMALAGAAVVGFVLARLVKSGLGSNRKD